MDDREFFLTRDGNRIHCKLDFPVEMPERCPVLILEHGLTGHMEERHILAVAETACEIGFAVLRVELYGHGKSDGAFRDHTILKWVEQMLDVVDYAASLPFAEELYLAGHSQGGLTAMLVGAMERDRLKAILPLAPAIVIWDGARKGNLLGRTFDPEHIPAQIDMGNGRTLSGNYLRTARLLNVEEAIRCFDKPVLIVHGDADESVPVRYAYEAARQYPNCRLKIINGDTHCYDNHLDGVCQAVREFLEEMRKG